MQHVAEAGKGKEGALLPGRAGKERESAGQPDPEGVQTPKQESSGLAGLKTLRAGWTSHPAPTGRRLLLGPGALLHFPDP